MHITANSKEVKPGSIFFALKGAHHDGHLFIREAFEKGAAQVFAERDVGIPGVIVLGNRTRFHLAELASEAAGHPSHFLKMIGVTGTSGKTTTTYLIEHILDQTGTPCARLGTNGGNFRGHEIGTVNTTPDPITLQNWFKEVASLGASAVVMEVSSHALHQERCAAIAWDSACFLNLSREHMDYHPSMDAYFAAKALLFQDHAHFSKGLGKPIHLHANADSEYGRRLIRENPEIQGYSVHRQVRNLKSNRQGIEFEWNSEGAAWLKGSCPLYGDFQIENILAALAVTQGLGVPPQAAVLSLENFKGVPGRMENISNDRGLRILVDYAHKPEALEKVLRSIQGARIWTVFGCGGDRDRTKRPVMGEIATRLSHQVILTSDNPRTEDPIKILEEIRHGIEKTNFEIIPDRKQAIERAIQNAGPGDTILIAGKGHETYQIIGSERRHFDDREIVRQAL